MLSNDSPLPTLAGTSSVLVTAAGPTSADVFDRFVRPQVADSTLVAVLYERPGTTFVEELAAGPGECPDDVRVLSVGETLRSTTRDGGHAGPSSTAIVGNVEQVDDVTTVERELDRFLAAWASHSGSSVLYVDSLTPLLRAVDAPLVGDFLERVTRTLRQRDALGVVRVEAATLDPQTLSGLGQRVDASIEIAGNGEDLEHSVVDPGAASWLAGRAGSERPPVDVTLDLLDTPERRAVLAYLSVARTATLADLGDYLAERADVPETDPDRLRIALYQVHLPKLVQPGAVALDEQERRVELRPPGEAVLAILEVATAYERP